MVPDFADGAVAELRHGADGTVIADIRIPGPAMAADELTRLGEERFVLLGSGPMQRYHMRWFQQNLPVDGSVRIENLTARY